MRNSLIDNARAVGIFAIVLGHVSNLPTGLYVWLFAFHVPLFFFVSGSVLTDASNALPLTSRLSQLAKTLLVPLLFFWVVAYLYWLPTHKLGGNIDLYKNYTALTPFQGLLISTGDSMPMNPPLWFFTALFCAALCYWCLRRFLGAASAACVALIGSVLTSIAIDDTSQYLPWNLDVAVSCLFFYAVGNLLRPALDMMNKASRSAILLGSIALAALCASTSLFHVNGAVDINHRQFGASCFLFYVNALLGIGGVVAVAGLIPRNAALEYVAANSLTIFAFHIVAFRFLTGILTFVLHIPRETLGAWPYQAIYVAWAFGTSLVLAYILDRVLPEALGKSRGGYYLFFKRRG